MARKRIGKSPGLQSPSPQSGFRLVIRPFAAESWQNAYRPATREPWQSRSFGRDAREDAAWPVSQERAQSGADGERPSGLPERLRAGIEHLSGLSMDAVSVHYDSPRPAPLDALAYAQGTDIHLGPGQAKHLAHEAWHVVQQMRGAVRPTLRAQDGVAINDDAGLEREAHVMGEQALRATGRDPTARAIPGRTTAAVRGQADARGAIIDPAMTEARPLAVTGWLGGHASRSGAGNEGRLPGPAVVQRLQAPPNPPKTEWNKTTIAMPKGAIAKESWLSYKAGVPPPAGYKPVADPPGYQYIRQAKLTKLWIRFHMINQKAGGPGTADNLIPASQRTNTDPAWKSMETKERNAWNAGRTYHFAVEVAYHPAHANPQLPGHHWQEYFPKKIDAAFSTLNAAGGWKTVQMAPIVPNLPPMDPKQVDYDLTQMTYTQLNSLLDTEMLGGFIKTNSVDLAKSMDADWMISDLDVLIADIDTEGSKAKLHRKKQLRREFTYAHKILHNFLSGIGIAKINLK